MKNSNNIFVIAISKVVELLCASNYNQFMESLKHPAERQELLLRRLLTDLSKTEYGRSVGINAFETYEEFSAKIRIVDYESLESLIEKQISSGLSILTPHQVVHTEPTSGSSGISKKIIYTKQLLNSFSNMFCIWAHDLLSHGLKLKTGKIFLSVSPTLKASSFTSDTNYLDGLVGALIAPFIVQPEGVLSALNYRQKLAETILREEKLEIISVWSPSYLISICQYIELHRRELRKILPTARAQILESERINWQLLFPHLQLISCWNSAHSAASAQLLAQLFPHVRIQGKGLLATEAPVTVPLAGTENGAPLIDDVFIELEDADGIVTRLHESMAGTVYQLIISQKAGLMRYRLNDFVEVCAPFAGTPTLKFIGKSNIICDMVGEKLHESFIRNEIGKIGNPSFNYVLVPLEANGFKQAAKYLFLTENSANLDAASLDQALMNGFHYHQSRKLGQLDILEIVEVKNLRTKLQQFFQDEGMKLGDLKDTALIADIAKAKRLLLGLNINSATSENNQQPLDRLTV